MGNFIDFPKRLGLTSPREQLEILKRMSSTELLACMLAKYPDVGFTFTADEMLAVRGKRIRVYPIGGNEWAIVPASTIGSDE